MKTQPHVKEGSFSRLSARGAITAPHDNSRAPQSSSRGSRAQQTQLSTHGANSARRRNAPVSQSSSSSSSSDSDPAPKAPVAGGVARPLRSSILRVATRTPPRKQRHIDSMNYLETLTMNVPFQKPDMCRVRNLRAMCIDVCLIYLKGTRFYDALKFMYASGMYATKLSIMKVNPAKYHLQFYLPKYPFTRLRLRLVLCGLGNFRLWGHLHLEFINVIFEDTERQLLIRAVEKLEPRSITIINCACNRPTSLDEFMTILEGLVGSKRVSVIGTRSMYERPYFSTDPGPGESSIDNKAPKRRKFHYCSNSD